MAASIDDFKEAPTGAGSGCASIGFAALEFVRPARRASQIVGVSTSAIPASVTGVIDRPQIAMSNPIPKTTCVSPTIETSAGWPAAYALVRKNCPMVPEIPTPRSISAVNGSSRSGMIPSCRTRQPDRRDETRDPGEVRDDREGIDPP